MIGRRRIPLLVAALAALAMGALLSGATQPRAAAQSEGVAYSIELDGSIDPATQSWISTALSDAADENAPLVIIRLDTPGGLDSSLRSIVADILAAPMPVVVYVSPDGARAASAGVFITEAGDVAAMAPQTNIGSASPISITGEDIGDTLGRKITNDAAAYVRALAESHGRNPDLAERMVTDAVNVTAQEALDADLIDLISPSEETLLSQLDGFEAKGPKAQTLQTAGLQIVDHEMPLRYEILQVLVNPNVAFLLLLVGIVGIAIEAFTPGGIVPGAIGALSLVLGIYGTVQLPVEALGVALLVLGVALIVAEISLAGVGVLGILGVISLAGSGLVLYDTNGEGFAVDPVIVITLAVVLGAGLIFVARKALAARRAPPRAGFEELIGVEAKVRSPLDPIGQVFVARGAVAGPDRPRTNPRSRPAVESGSSRWTG